MNQNSLEYIHLTKEIVFNITLICLIPVVLSPGKKCSLGTMFTFRRFQNHLLLYNEV